MRDNEIVLRGEVSDAERTEEVKIAKQKVISGNDFIKIAERQAQLPRARVEVR
jgi:hypothetical protein